MCGIVLVGDLHENNIYFIKLDRHGNLAWGFSMTGTSINVCNSVAIDPNTDMIYAAGYYARKLVIAQAAVLDSNYLNFYLARFDPSGNLEW